MIRQELTVPEPIIMHWEWAFAYGKDKKVENYQHARKIFGGMCRCSDLPAGSVWKKFGMFDEKHFAYLEDVDVGYRARIAGYDNRYEPKAEVIHVGSAASGARYNEFFSCFLMLTPLLPRCDLNIGKRAQN